MGKSKNVRNKRTSIPNASSEQSKYPETSKSPDDTFYGLMGFEELTDYEVVGGSLKKKSNLQSESTKDGRTPGATKNSGVKSQKKNQNPVAAKPNIKNVRIEGNKKDESKKKKPRKLQFEVTNVEMTQDATKNSGLKSREKNKPANQKPLGANLISGNFGVEGNRNDKSKKKKKQAKIVSELTVEGDIQKKTAKEAILNKEFLQSNHILKCLPDENSVVDSQEAEHNTVAAHMGQWSKLGVPPVLIRALEEKSFITPTKIQALTLPSAIFGRRDIVGAAETGSGKTLAFGLPILTGILEEVNKDENQQQRNKNSGACIDDDEDDDNDDENDDFADNDEDLEEMERCDDFLNSPGQKNGAQDFASGSDSENERIDDAEDFEESEMPSKIDEVFENVADFPNRAGKKTRSKYVGKPLYALVLTPTRELAVQISQHLKAAAKYTTISVAVVVGGLATQKQERVLNRGPAIVVATPGRLWELINEGHPHFLQLHKLKYLAIDETDRMLEKGHFEELDRILVKVNRNVASLENRQNFVFSATLALTHKAPSYLLKRKRQQQLKGKYRNMTPAEKLSSIMDTVGMTNPKIVDITECSGVAQRLQEAQIICPEGDKDSYLYYFLKRHPGRTLVFCNSIDCVRRLTQLLTLLECSPKSLHAQMFQKQRLKNLERFRADPRGLLLATDVAARGLDIPNVQHVIHYQIPHTAESYVHRSGRTARAQLEGLTVLFTDPSEVVRFSRIFQTLGRDLSALPTFPVEAGFLKAVRERVKLAQELDKATLQDRRAHTDRNWVDKMAKEMDLILTDDEQSDHEQENVKKMNKQTAALRRQLNALLCQPLIPRELLLKSKCVVPLNPNFDLCRKDMYQQNAVEALKCSVVEKKALKRKRDHERSKQHHVRRKMSKLETTESKLQSNSGGDEDGSS